MVGLEKIRGTINYESTEKSDLWDSGSLHDVWFIGRLWFGKWKKNEAMFQ